MKDRISDAECIPLFSLGELANSDFVTHQPKDVEKFPMDVVFSPKTGLLQLAASLDTSKMYGKYWYRSGTNETMKAALKDIVDSVCRLHYTKGRSGLWLDIASNDNTLLSQVPNGMRKLGIDPSYGSCKPKIPDGIEVITDFFSKNAYRKSSPGLFQEKCDVITAIAMFYDLDDPRSFLKDVHDILDDDGVFVLQLSYTPLMVKQLEVGNFCFEHVAYYNMHSLNHVITECGFKMVDVELNDINGGSFRVYLQKNEADPASFGSPAHRDVAQMRISSLFFWEESIGVMDPDYYKRFWKKCLALKTQVVDFVKRVKADGKSVYLLGASTKGNTLLQWFGLDKTLIDGASERSSYKHGLRTIVTDIPIYSEEIVRALNPDYMLVLPWHFANELKEREHDMLSKGTKFIFPSPRFEVFGL